MDPTQIPQGEHALLWWFIGGLITAVMALAGAVVRLWSWLQAAKDAASEAKRVVLKSEASCTERINKLNSDWQERYIDLERRNWQERSGFDKWRAWAEAEIMRLSVLSEGRGQADQVDAVICCHTDTGLISSWNAGATMLLGWSSDETKGRHINMLVPERYQHRQKEAWNDCIAKRDGVPKRGPDLVHANTRWKREVAVTILYSCYDEDGCRVIKATIRRRSEKPKEDSGEFGPPKQDGPDPNKETMEGPIPTPELPVEEPKHDSPGRRRR
jgi:PAS domain S-box-containing protein